MKNLNHFDNELRLLTGRSLYFETLPVHSITLGAAIDFGYSDYQNLIFVMCLSTEGITEHFQIEHCSAFTFLYQTCILALSKLETKETLPDEIHFASSIFSLLELLFQEEINLDLEQPAFLIGGKGRLDEDNFSHFQAMIRKRNCLGDSEPDTASNPDSEMTRRMLEKRKQLREKVRRAKVKQNSEDEPLTIADLISIFAEEEQMYLQDVCNKYDIYQFNDQFNRMTIMADYHVNIQALMAGAKKEDIKLKHWLSKPTIKGGN